MLKTGFPSNPIPWKPLACLFLFLALTGFQLSAQRLITGTITDEKTGEPLIGANVTVVGTTTGTVSDVDGNYSLNLPAGATEIDVSYTGYTTQRITVGASNVINVVLAAGQLLDEVVVTSLGIEKSKSRVGFAVQDVKGDELIKAREPNPINSLTGKVAGLTVGISPELLGGPAVLLRGRQPLYVVDGVPIQSDTWNLNPDDIESITVLKGPAASALYGSRGQFGAIQVTTKRGSKDQRGYSIDFNSSTMMESSFIAIPKVQFEYGPGDHGRYSFVDGKGGGLYDADYDIWGPKFEGQPLTQYDSPIDPATGQRIPTPWISRGANNLERFLRPGIVSTNNLAVSAKGDNYDLRFSGTYAYQQGIVPNSQLNTTNFNISSGFDFSDKLRLDANLNYNRQFTDNFPDVTYGPNSMIYNIILWGGADWDVDDMRDYWQPGKEGIQQIYAEYTRYNNPWFMAKEWLRGHYKTDIYGTAALTYKINPYLNLVGRTQITTYNIFRNEKFPYSATVYGREQAKGDYREDRRNLFENNTDLLLTYNKLFGKLDLTVSGGGNVRTFTYSSNFASTDYLNVPGWYNLNNSLNPRQVFNFDADMAVLSAYGFADLSYDGFLNLSITGRWDKNSTLPSSSNSYFYPSASLSFLLSDVLRMPKAISFVKLRGSYAYVGSGLTRSTVGPAFYESGRNILDYGGYYFTPYEGPRYANSAGYSIGFPYNNQPAAYFPNTIVNPNLEPSFSSAFETGADIRFFGNRIGLDLTYFRTIDGPEIFSLPISTATGYSDALENGIKVLKTGWEVVLNASPVKTRDFKWDVTANWSTYKQVLDEVYPGVNQISRFIQVGERIDQYFASTVVRAPDGQIINDGSGRPIRNPSPQFLGYTNPDWTWGISSRINWKNFAMGFQFDGRVGGVLINYVQRQTFRGGRHIETVQGAMGEARYQDYKGVKSWVGPGVAIANNGTLKYDVDGNVTNYNELTFTPNTTATFLQDWISRYYATEEANLMTRTYAKLRELTLSYTLPQSALGGAFRQFTISLVGRNLLYFAEKKDVDLDQYVGGDGYSTLQTPTMRRFGINFNVTF